MTQTSGIRIGGESKGDQAVVLAWEGELDLYIAPELKRELFAVITQGHRRIVVDLTPASFIDSTILSVLLAGVKRLRPVGGELAVICPNENIRRLFEVTLLDQVFPVINDRSEIRWEGRDATRYDRARRRQQSPSDPRRAR